WQNVAGLALPFNGSANAASPNAVFKATNTGTGYGIWGEGSDGVHGISAATGGNGVFGEADNGIGAYGVYGVSTGGRGVFGSSYSGYGVYGISQIGSAGVYGNSITSPGVFGESSGNFGVYGLSTVTNGVGVYGASNSGTTA